MVMPSLHRDLDRDPILRALSSFYGITTGDGNVGGTTLICSILIGANDFISNKTILLESGAAIYEHRSASAFNPANGQITVAPAFSAQVLEGVGFYILNTADVALIAALIAAIKAQTDKLAGDETTGTHAHANNVNWQTVFTIDPSGLRRKINSIYLNFVNLTQNTIYRLSYNQGGTGYEVFDSNALVPWTPADDNLLLLQAHDFVIAHELRCEVQSQVLEGAVRNIPYEVYWEQME